VPDAPDHSQQSRSAWAYPRAEYFGYIFTGYNGKS
jgi:hypothetical protein